MERENVVEGQRFEFFLVAYYNLMLQKIKGCDSSIAYSAGRFCFLLAGQISSYMFCRRTIACQI